MQGSYRHSGCHSFRNDCDRNTIPAELAMSASAMGMEALQRLMLAVPPPALRAAWLWALRLPVAGAWLCQWRQHGQVRASAWAGGQASLRGRPVFSRFSADLSVGLESEEMTLPSSRTMVLSHMPSILRQRLFAASALDVQQQLRSYAATLRRTPGTGQVKVGRQPARSLTGHQPCRQPPALSTQSTGHSPPPPLPPA
jgi:hypothetical protein